MLLQCSNLSFRVFLEQQQPSFRPVSVYPYWNNICQFTSIIRHIFTLLSLTNQTCFIPRHKKDILMFLLCRAQLVMLPHLKNVINMESLSNHGAEPSQDQSCSSSQFCVLHFATNQHIYSGKSLIQEFIKWKFCSSTEINDLLNTLILQGSLINSVFFSNHPSNLNTVLNIFTFVILLLNERKIPDFLVIRKTVRF